MGLYNLYNTAAGGRMPAFRSDERDMTTGLHLRPHVGLGYRSISDMPADFRNYSTFRPAAPAVAASMSGGPRNRAGDLLNSLLGQVNSGSRGLIDEAAMGAKSAADSAYGAMIRNLSRMGVNPQSPRFAGTMRQWAADRTATEAAARNDAARKGQGDTFGRMFSLYNALQETDEAERNRQFQASQGRESRSWQSGESAAGRSWQDQGAQRNRGWQIEDRDTDARARQAEAEQYMQVLDAYSQSQKPPAPASATKPPATKPRGLVVLAHTEANFPTPVRTSSNLPQPRSGGIYSTRPAPSQLLM